MISNLQELIKPLGITLVYLGMGEPCVLLQTLIIELGELVLVGRPLKHIDVYACVPHRSPMNRSNLQHIPSISLENCKTPLLTDSDHHLFHLTFWKQYLAKSRNLAAKQIERVHIYVHRTIQPTLRQTVKVVIISVGQQLEKWIGVTTHIQCRRLWAKVKHH